MMNVWKNMKPKNKRLAVIASAFAAFALVIAIIPEDDKSNRGQYERPPVGSMITDKQNDDARSERLQAQLNNMRSENANLNNEVDRLRRDMERLELGEVGPTLAKQLDDLKDKIQLMERNQGYALDPKKEQPIVIGQKTESENTSSNGANNNNSDQPMEEQPKPSTPTIDAPKIIDEPYISQEAPKGRIPDESIWESPVPQQPETDTRQPSRGRDVASNETNIRVIESADPVVEMEEEATEDKEDQGIYIPAGSIVTGTLITGMDAPTGQGARSEPFPALLRVKHEAILPNRFRADIRECLIILGGYGDISSERAYLRGETISCVRDDGGVIESSFDSFTVGEDGKAGIRGRLVSKQGQVLAKAMTAGVLQGFAEAFGSNKVPTLSVESTETPLYQQAFSSDALQSGAASGASTALDRLAQFYIDQADGMFPVIEIDAGREIELVMVNGGMLAIK